MERLLGILDHTGNIYYISPGFEKDAGQVDILGSHVNLFVHPEDYEETKNTLCKTKGFKPYTIVNIRIRPSDSIEWTPEELKLVPLVNSSGSFDYILIFKEESENMEISPDEISMNMFDNVNLVMWSVDGKTGKGTISGNCSEILGVSPEEFEQNPYILKKYVHPHDLMKVSENEKNIILNQTTSFQYKKMLPNREIKWIFVKVIPTTDLSGNIVRVDGLCVDITNQKQQLRLESAHSITGKELFLNINSEGVITDVFHSAFNAPEELKLKLIGSSIFSHFEEVGSDKVKEYFLYAIKGKQQEFTTPLIYKNLCNYQLNVKAFPLPYNHNGINILAIIQYRNITIDTKRRLHKNEISIKSLGYSEKMGIWQYNKQTNQMLISPGIEKISGYLSKDFLLNQDLYQKIIFPEDFESVKTVAENIEDGRIVMHEYRIITKNKQIKWLQERVFPTLNSHSEVISLEGIWTDVTDEKNSQLDSLINLYQSLMGKNKAGIATVDLNGEFTSVNETAQEITGFSELELLSMNYMDLLLPCEKKRVYDSFINMIYHDKEIQNDTIEMVHKRGHPVNLNVLGVPIFNGENISGMYVIATDISSKLELEEQLLQDRQAFYEIYNQLNLAIFVTEPQKEKDTCRILEANRYACELLGYKYEEMVKMSCHDIVPSRNFRVKAFMESNKEYINMRTILLTKNGEKVPVSLYSHYTEWEGKEIVLSIVRDINIEKISMQDRSLLDDHDSGRMLRILMAEMNINTAELAQMTKLTPATISNLRTGKVKKPNIETAEKIAEVLGVKISFIWPSLSY